MSSQLTSSEAPPSFLLLAVRKAVTSNGKLGGAWARGYSRFVVCEKLISYVVQIAELKSKLEINTPKQQVFDPAEATRSEVYCDTMKPVDIHTYIHTYIHT